MFFIRILLAMALVLPAAARPAECTARSGAGMNALVELFTSEGCSSCPPADRWLSGLGAEPGARVVPLAWHVHYWDYIGWKDAYADVRYTQRQRDLAAASGSRMVYTPQVMIAGRDAPGWSDAGTAAKAIAAAQARKPGATIEIHERSGTPDAVQGSVASILDRQAGSGDWTLYVALVQSGLSSRVTAGENKGATLEHRYVVRDLKAIPVSSAASTRIEAPFDFRAQRDWSRGRMALVAFVQSARTGEVLQALSAPLCAPL